MNRKLVVWLLFLPILSCNRTPTEPELRDILEKLQALPGVFVQEIAPHYGYPRAFQIDMVQPVDHQNPGGAQFTQRMYLSHTDETMPMVFAPGGYGVTERSGQEIAGINFPVRSSFREKKGKMVYMGIGLFNKDFFVFI